jgi:hypothetical protein
MAYWEDNDVSMERGVDANEWMLSEAKMQMWIDARRSEG